MDERQLSLFDLMAAPVPEEKQVLAQEEAPRLCSISASAECGSGGYHVFGTVNASVCPGSFEPSARFMLDSYPIFDYYLKHEYLARDLIIDIFLHLLDENGKCQNMTADAHYTIRADALYDAMHAAESF